MLDPAFRCLFKEPAPDWSDANYLELRKGPVLIPALPDDAIATRVVAAPVPHAPDVPLIVHAPKPRRLRGLILHIHGGGTVSGSARRLVRRQRRLAMRLDCVVLSVEYRLAPEHAAPAALDDCHAAYAWVHRHAEELAVDPCRLVVMGESAGGGIAAALALRVRDGGQLPFAHQHLHAPMLDDRPVALSPHAPLRWTAASNAWAWRAYLGRDPSAAALASVPARAADLSRLPPAYLSVGALDLFAPQVIAYAERLMQAGVATELHVYPGAPHGFLDVLDARASRQERRLSLAALRRALLAPSG